MLDSTSPSSDGSQPGGTGRQRPTLLKPMISDLLRTRYCIQSSVLLVEALDFVLLGESGTPPVNHKHDDNQAPSAATATETQWRAVRLVLGDGDLAIQALLHPDLHRLADSGTVRVGAYISMTRFEARWRPKTASERTYASSSSGCAGEMVYLVVFQLDVVGYDDEFAAASLRTHVGEEATEGAEAEAERQEAYEDAITAEATTPEAVIRSTPVKTEAEGLRHDAIAVEVTTAEAPTGSTPAKTEREGLRDDVMAVEAMIAVEATTIETPTRSTPAKTEAGGLRDDTIAVEATTAEAPIRRTPAKTEREGARDDAMAMDATTAETPTRSAPAKIEREGARDDAVAMETATGEAPTRRTPAKTEVQTNMQDLEDMISSDDDFEAMTIDMERAASRRAAASQLAARYRTQLQKHQRGSSLPWRTMRADPRMAVRLTPLRAVPNLPYSQNWTVNVLAVVASLSEVEPARLAGYRWQRVARLADPTTSKLVHLTVFLDPEQFRPAVGSVVLLTGVKNHRFDGGSLKKYADGRGRRGGGSTSTGDNQSQSKDGSAWWLENPVDLDWCDVAALWEWWAGRTGVG